MSLDPAILARYFNGRQKDPVSLDTMRRAASVMNYRPIGAAPEAAK